MKILTKWLRAYLPGLTVTDAQLAEDLTLRGIAVEGIYDLGTGNGSLYEMDITTNRVDAMNHYGVAREAAAIYGLPLSELHFALPDAKPAAQPFSVQIEAQDACGRFTARVLRNITIGESRDLPGTPVVTYFNLLEQKKISDAVDATNFAWLAMGQPTHAFDLDKIQGGIIVRRARKGEQLKTLDGMVRNLDPEDLVVADHVKPLGLAGVMGGWDSMITPNTKNVLVEAAWFDPVAVRRTARRHGLHTDASHRFERGADFNAAPVASALVSSILLENGGHIEGDLVDIRIPAAEARTAHRPAVALALSEVQRILGTTIDPEGITASTVEGVLTAIGCGLTGTESAWQVTLPSWRLDLEREIDLIEEVARVYGYNRFANTLPTFGEGVQALPWAESDAIVRSTMRAAGFHETIGSTFCSASDATLTAPQPGLVVPLGNPLSEEAGVMRPSLVPGMLTQIAGNLNRDVSDVRLFELGTVFSGTTDKVEERPSLAFGAAGLTPEQGPLHAARPIEFYDLKGIVEQLAARFETHSVYFDRFPAESGLTPVWLHPYRSARLAVEGETAGWFGQLHPREAAARKIKDTVFLGEIYIDRLYKLSLRKPAARDISRFQPVRRDFSLILDESISWESIDQAIAGLSIAELVDWHAREVFRDKKLGRDYSLLLGVTFQAPDRTLREEDLQDFQTRVVEAVGKAGARLRA
ncbi:phenylalanine--tRNA ligase subunit beta [Occallatibacter riparius]|uniref:Phenylalanine--tRNA ligase beta subunit n=1 Tax=Occallatibacter riparius TaxID=1002689 RepID=A0A9J7BX74_9BACT|nr:phenylalanine--tRNA ligase subunit beta [Occallatibacter riparius]UWZ86474.1 phenylalanine--tRNA ligase subunit beta [Occallatibacter riparius]